MTLKEQIKLNELQTVEITYADGSKSTTDVSDKVNQEDIEKYFVGQRFNLAAYPHEKMVKAVSVRFLENKNKHAKLLESIFKAKKVIKEMARPVFNLKDGDEVIEKHGAEIIVNHEKITARGYSGNRSKPDFAYRFRTEKELNDYIEKYFQNIEKKIADKIKRREQGKVKAKEIVDSTQIGDIFYTSWGYEQSNSEFYQVVDKKGSSLVVREIAQDLEHSEGMHSMSGHATPQKDNFIGKEIVVNVRGPYPSVGNQSIYKWDGRPIYVSWYA